MPTVDAATFQRDFGRYRDVADQEPVRVTSQGKVVGAFLSSHDLEDYERLKRLERRIPVAGEAEHNVVDATKATAGFHSADEQEAYDCWYRGKVEAALAGDKSRISHEVAMARIDALIESKRHAPPRLDR